MKKGFTLIELMIVVVIIGILAAIAIPKYQNVTTNAKAATIIGDTRVLLNAAQLYLTEKGEYPPDCIDFNSIPEGMEEYLPEGFIMDRHYEDWNVRFTFDNYRNYNGREMPSYAQTFGAWIAISVLSKDQELMNAITEVAPGYTVPLRGFFGYLRLAVVIEPYNP